MSREQHLNAIEAKCQNILSETIAIQDEVSTLLGMEHPDPPGDYTLLTMVQKRLNWNWGTSMDSGSTDEPRIHQAWPGGSKIAGLWEEDGPWRPDYDWMAEQIEDKTPPGFDGYGYMDIEGAVMNAFGNPGHPRFDEAAMIYELHLRVAKEVRPDMKWTFYGFPVREYWQQTPAFWNHNVGVVSALGVDWWAPSIYDYYRTDPDRDDARFGWLVRLAVAMAHGRPVIPMVWHRYHPNAPHGLSLIPDDEHIRQMRNAIVNGANGLCAYGDDPLRWQYACRDGGTKPAHQKFRAAMQVELGTHNPRLEQHDEYMDEVIVPRIHANMRSTVDPGPV